jgi:hypothetical protein
VSWRVDPDSLLFIDLSYEEAHELLSQCGAVIEFRRALEYYWAPYEAWTKVAQQATTKPHAFLLHALLSVAKYQATQLSITRSNLMQATRRE